MYKILLTGGTGFFLSNWILDTKNLFRNFALVRKKNKNKFLKSFKVNFRNNNEIVKILKKIKPQIIIHNAAITDVDYCEKNKKISEEVNLNLSKKISTICKKQKIKLIFISSDQVFSKDNKNYENSKKNPINIYSLHKSKAEDFIRKNLKNYLIIRTNFFGIAPPNKKSFFNFVKDNLEMNNTINLIEDVIHNPISVHYLNKYIIYLIKNNNLGTFHISSNEKISKYELGNKISKIFKLKTKLIKKSKLSLFNFKAERPKIMYLNNLKLKKTTNKKIPSIQKQLMDIKNKIHNNYYNNIKY